MVHITAAVFVGAFVSSHAHTQYCHWLSCHCVAVLVSSDGVHDRRRLRRLESHSMSVTCQLCISLISLGSSRAPGRWILRDRPVGGGSRPLACLCIFLTVACWPYLTAAAKPAITPPIWGASVWTDAQQHGPAVLHLHRSLQHEILNLQHTVFDDWHISMYTKVEWGQSAAVEGGASQPVADCKCLHLIFGMFLSVST